MSVQPRHRWFNISQAACYADVSRSTIEGWMARGLLPYEELPGRGNGNHRFRRIRECDIDTFLDSHYKLRGKAVKNNTPKKLILLPKGSSDHLNVV